MTEMLGHLFMKRDLEHVRTVVSVLAAAVITAMALTTASAQAAPAGQTITAASFGPYEFKNDYSHLCMDVAYGSTADGARIQQWDCYGGTPEKWRLDEISVINGVHYYACVNVNSGKCLDVPNGSKDRGVELVQWTCWTGDMQQWAFYRAGGSSVTIRNLRSGLCVDVKDWMLRWRPACRSGRSRGCSRCRRGCGATAAAASSQSMDSFRAVAAAGIGEGKVVA